MRSPLLIQQVIGGGLIGKWHVPEIVGTAFSALLVC
jgi:hypothetical protein